MSIKDVKAAIKDIADEMVREADDLKGKPEDAWASYMCSTLRGYARSLRAIYQAAGDDLPPAPSLSPQSMSDLLSPQAQHIREIEKHRAEFRKPVTREHGDLEEKHEGEITLVVGGPADPDGDGTFYPIDPNMPVGAFTAMAGGVYQMEKPENGQKRLVHQPDYGKAQREAS